MNDKNSEMLYNGSKREENDLLQTEKLELDTFSYHLTTQYTAMFGVMIFVMLIEIFPFHLLFSRWSDVIAWGVTLLSILFILFMIYDYIKIKSKPILLNSKILTVHRGVIRHVDIPLESIKAIHTTVLDKEDATYMDLALLNEKNIYLDLLEPVIIKSIFKSKKGEKIAFYVDEQYAFIKQLKEYTRGI